MDSSSTFIIKGRLKMENTVPRKLFLSVFFVASGLFLFSVWELSHIRSQAEHIRSLRTQLSNLSRQKDLAEKTAKEPAIVKLSQGTLYVFNKKSYGIENAETLLEIVFPDGKTSDLERYDENENFVSFLLKKSSMPVSLRAISSDGIRNFNISYENYEKVFIKIKRLSKTSKASFAKSLRHG